MSRGRTLADLINKSGGSGLPESTVSHITRYILIGLSSIHNHGYVYPQLRPDTILLLPNTSTTTDHNYIANINFDFGLAKGAKGTEEINGCVKYLSPELAVDDNKNNNVVGLFEDGCDIWALGCIVLEMLTGKSMWDGIEDSDIVRLLRRIGKGHGFLKLSTDIISKEGKDFLKGCLARKAVDRLTAEELLNHPFVAAAGLLEEFSTTNVDIKEVFEEKGTREFGYSSSFSGNLDYIPLDQVEESQEAVSYDGEGISGDDFIPLEVEDKNEHSEECSEL